MKLLAFLQFLKDYKDAFEASEALITILAIAIAGWWTWKLFIRHRKGFPKLTMTYVTWWWDVNEDTRILRVTLNLKNDSEVLLQLKKRHTWVQQIKPWSPEVLNEIESRKSHPTDCDEEIKWPLLAERSVELGSDCELEPQESDEISMDFIIPHHGDDQVVMLYTYFENVVKQKRDIGWRFSKVVDFSEGEGVVEEKTMTTEPHRVGKSTS